MPAATEKQRAEYVTSPRETRALLDEMARRYLGVSYAEFLRRFERGEYDREQPEVIRLALLRDFAA